ncbi:MAG TPA: helix-turn-helix transcriptional regulator [Actinocatenispora sp.]
MGADFVGHNVAVWRRRRGMTQRVLADLCGFSQAYVSMLEQGRRAIDKRSTVVALAEALRVSVAELTGQPYPPVDPGHERATAAVPAVRAALISLSYDDIPAPGGPIAGGPPPEGRTPGGRTPSGPTPGDPTPGDPTPGDPASGRPAEAVLAAAGELAAARRRCDYVRALALAPVVLPDLALHRADARMMSALVLAVHDVAFVVKHLGHADLAYQAATLCAGLAARTGDATLVGLADYTRLQALPPESRQLGRRLATQAIDDLGRRLTDCAGRRVYGQLQLTAGWTDALAGRTDDAAAHLDEADRIAAAVGDPADGGFGGTNFGPANVTQWRVSIAIETGEPGRALALADTLDPRRIAAPSRRTAYHIDVGHALTQTRRDRAALGAFLAAERLAPQRVRLSPTVRDSVGAMVRRAHRTADTDLHALADRLGVT